MYRSHDWHLSPLLTICKTSLLSLCAQLDGVLKSSCAMRKG
jgi:hypothetical protein